MKVILTIIIISVACISCRKPEDQPELRDPVYIDLQKRLSLAEKDLKTATDLKPKLEEEFKPLNEQTGEYKAKRAEIFKNAHDILIAEQKVNYFMMAIDSRRKEARLSYLKYFKENKESEWPDKNEFLRYKNRIDNNEYLKGSQ